MLTKIRDYARAQPFAVVAVIEYAVIIALVLAHLRLYDYTQYLLHLLSLGG